MSRLIFLSILAAFLYSCNDASGPIPDQNADDCTDFFLSRYNMEPASQRPTCGVTFLELFKNEETFFAVFQNDCVDLQPRMLEDCNGNELCVYVVEIGCGQMVFDSELIGIIGVE